MIDEDAIRTRYAAIKGQLDERGRRLFVAAEKATAGYGGTAAVSRATGVARSTIIRGAKDLIDDIPATTRIRRKGAGRPLSSTVDPTVLEGLRRLVEPATMGNPMRPLLWVSKSREKLAAALHAMNHAISANTVAKMLVTLGYSRQVNRKTKEGSHHADRDGQFQHIACQAMAFQAAGQPVISVDTKKKELIGEYKNGGSDYRPRAAPTRSRCMTLSTRTSARWHLTAFMTSPPTQAGSASGSTTTRRHLPSTRSVAGMRKSAASATTPRIGC
jgi:hypothetical protein